MTRGTLSPFLILGLPMKNLDGRASLLACGLALSLLAACSPSASPVATPPPTPSRLGPAMVQVENSILARPQSGLQQADLVYEYLAEGGITRMTVIYFNPSGRQRIEPVRRARPGPPGEQRWRHLLRPRPEPPRPAQPLYRRRPPGPGPEEVRAARQLS